MAKIRVKVPKTAKAGEIITIKTLISHKMETGLRKNKKTGKKIPRHIINKFTAKFDGKMFFESDWHAGISANPYLSFPFRAQKSGEFEFVWHDEKGKVFTTKASIKVE